MSENPEALNDKSDGATYVAFPVRVEGIGTYEQILLFLKRFSQVNLLQRLSQFDVLITTPGDPRLIIRFTAEGLAMNDADDRSTIFPTSLLVDDLAADQKLLTVAETKGFPEKAPFRVRIGTEWLDVTAVNKNQWTVTRAIDQSQAAAHPKGSELSLFPVRSEGTVEPTVETVYAKLAAANPFRKPRPPVQFKPRLNPSGSLLVTKGTPWTVNVKAESWDPEAGAPKFVAESELPAGLALDEKTGALKWSPAKDFAAGEYPVKIAAIGSFNDKIRASTELKIKVRDANRPPVIRDARPPVAYLGRPWTFDLSATDPDPNDKLKYAFSGTPPKDAVIDASGKVTWTPAEDAEAGEVPLAVTVTDSGDPPMTATRSVNIRVEDDAARFTKFVGVVTEGGVAEAWFFDPSINRSTKLKSGSLFKFADVEGTVDAIDEAGAFVVLSTGGQRMRLVSGKTIREMTPEAAPASPPASAAANPGPAGTVPGSSPVPGTAPQPAAAPQPAPAPAPAPQPAPVPANPSAT